MKLKLPRRKMRPLPTQAELDEAKPRRATLLAILSAGALVAWTASWWAKNGSGFLDELAFRLETLYIYWTLVASPLDRKVWTFIAVAILLLAVLALVLFRRFVWRAVFPDLVRLDPDAHAGGRPEPLGRLYRIRKFRDSRERVMHRHYYKHGHRWFPLFRFDHVDLEKPAEPYVFGVCVIRCGRLERDLNGSRFKRVVAEGPYATHALEDAFRREEVELDQLRKMNIVAPGPGMNPDVMRKKWRDEAMINPWPEKRIRRVLDTVNEPAEEP